MKIPITILIIDDTYAHSELCAQMLNNLSNWQVNCLQCETGKEALIAIQNNDPDVIFVDYLLEVETGVDIILSLREAGSNAAFVMLTGFDSIKAAAEAVRAGAIDYLIKTDLSKDLLDRCLRYVTSKKQSEEELKKHRDNLEELVEERTAEMIESNKQLHLEIAKHRQTEAQLRTANEAKSDFLTNVNHELRTPMNGIIGLTQLTLGAELPTEQRDNLEMVLYSANSLLALINDLFDFSEIESKQFHLNIIDFSLRDSVKKVVDKYIQKANEKELVFLYNINPDVPDALFGDSKRFQQIMIHLLDNAIKFTSKGQVEFKVETALEHKKAQMEKQNKVYLHFIIIDTGVGIPPEKLDLIFDSFTQVDGSYTRAYNGSGLGLAISKEIVTMMDGKIWVESQVNKGSEFHCIIQVSLQGSVKK